jgi:hypothetical protein
MLQAIDTYCLNKKSHVIAVVSEVLHKAKMLIFENVAHKSLGTIANLVWNTSYCLCSNVPKLVIQATMAKLLRNIIVTSRLC